MDINDEELEKMVEEKMRKIIAKFKGLPTQSEQETGNHICHGQFTEIIIRVGSAEDVRVRGGDDLPCPTPSPCGCDDLPDFKDAMDSLGPEAKNLFKKIQEITKDKDIDLLSKIARDAIKRDLDYEIIEWAKDLRIIPAPLKPVKKTEQTGSGESEVPEEEAPK